MTRDQRHARKLLNLVTQYGTPSDPVMQPLHEPPRGDKLVDVDFSAIEARVLAHMAVSIPCGDCNTPDECEENGECAIEQGDDE
jgi:hypothetical protein